MVNRIIIYRSSHFRPVITNFMMFAVLFAIKMTIVFTLSATTRPKFTLAIISSIRNNATRPMIWDIAKPMITMAIISFIILVTIFVMMLMTISPLSILVTIFSILLAALLAAMSIYPML